MDLYKVDLKGFDDKRYRQLGGRLEPILDTIRRVHAAGIWMEIVTLLVPGFNDGEAELRQLTTFVAGVSPDIPWHVTAYHEDYRMSGTGNTTAGMLDRAARIGREAGLQYVYAGNIPGAVGDLENTRCPACQHAGRAVGLPRRRYGLTKDGALPLLPGRGSRPLERVR